MSDQRKYKKVPRKFDQSFASWKANNRDAEGTDADKKALCIVDIVKGTQLIDCVFKTDGKNQFLFVGGDQFTFSRSAKNFADYKCTTSVFRKQCSASVSLPIESKSGHVKGFARDFTHEHSRYPTDSYNEDGILKELIQMTKDIEILKQSGIDYEKLNKSGESSVKLKGRALQAYGRFKEAYDEAKTYFFTFTSSANDKNRLYAYFAPTVNDNSTLHELIYAIIYGGQSGSTVEKRTGSARPQKKFIADVEDKCETLMIKQMDLFKNLPVNFDKRAETAMLGCFRRTDGDFESRLINADIGNKSEYFGKDIEIDKRISSLLVVMGLGSGKLKDVDFNQQRSRMGNSGGSRYPTDSYNEDGILKELIQMTKDIEILKQSGIDYEKLNKSGESSVKLKGRALQAYGRFKEAYDEAKTYFFTFTSSANDNNRLYAYFAPTVDDNSTLHELIYAIIYGGQSGSTVELRTGSARPQKKFIADVEDKCETLMIKQMDLFKNLPVKFDKRAETAMLGCFRRTDGDFESRLINIIPGNKSEYFGKDIEIDKRISSLLVVMGLGSGKLKDVDFNQQYGRKRKLVDPFVEASS